MARLRASLAGSRGERFVCFALDILYLDGFDLRPAPLNARNQLLAALLTGRPEALRFSDHMWAERAQTFHRHRSRRRRALRRPFGGAALGKHLAPAERPPRADARFGKRARPSFARARDRYA